MRNVDQIFDAKVEDYKAYQHTPWGRLRARISFANIQRHLNGRALHILDVGGGNGLDAIAFAKQGHTVALLDCSAEMLAEARCSVEAHGLTDHMTYYHADLSTIPSVFPDSIFDMILCHNVLPYVDDMTAMLRTICHPLRSNGMLSLMCINRYSEAYRQAIQQHDLFAAYDSLNTTTVRSATMEIPLQAYAADEVIQTLPAIGCSLVGQYGILCICGYLPNNELKTDPRLFAQLEQLEYAMSDTYPYYLLARSFQIIACKT